MRHALVLRPQPGAARTAERLRALGVSVRTTPLFTVVPEAWSMPASCAYDALVLTSANAVRHAGTGLRALADLPVLAVGKATAQAAEAAGLRVAVTGASDAAALMRVAADAGYARPLHLTGRHRGTLPGADQRTVYASVSLDPDPATVRGWAGQVALIHSARAARRFAALADRHALDRATIAVVALSDAVAAATGSGWERCVAAHRPDDEALTALARSLIDPPAADADKPER